VEISTEMVKELREKTGAGILDCKKTLTETQGNIERAIEVFVHGFAFGRSYTHHYIPDLRWYLAALALGLYARTTVVFRPLDRDRTMPLLVAFLLIGFFIWLAENISTFFGIWRYPNQLGAWTSVHVGKWSSWSLLVVMTFTIVANLKHIKERIHIPE